MPRQPSRVTHTYYTSGIRAHDPAFVLGADHKATGDAIKEAGLRYTILRTAQTCRSRGRCGSQGAQYATTHRAEYRVVWWVLADDPASMEQVLAEPAFRLHPDVQ